MLLRLFLQLEVFRTLNDEDGKMTHNFRPTQPIHDRQIYYNPGNDIDDINNAILKPMKDVKQKRSSANVVLTNNPFLSALIILIIVRNY